MCSPMSVRAQPGEGASASRLSGRNGAGKPPQACASYARPASKLAAIPTFLLAASCPALSPAARSPLALQEAALLADAAMKMETSAPALRTNHQHWVTQVDAAAGTITINHGASLRSVLIGTD